jgi:hypothetical protein
MSVYEALGISVTAGILVLCLTWASKILWTSVIENLWLKLACMHLPNISGVWEAIYESPEDYRYSEVVHLKQYGHRVNGISTFSIEDIKTHVKEEREYRIVGILRNDLLSCYYYNANRRQKGSGSFTLSLMNSGEKMLGHGAFYDTDESKVLHVEYELIYKKGSSNQAD